MKKVLLVFLITVLAISVFGCKKSLPPNTTQEFYDIGIEISQDLDYFINDEMACTTLHKRAEEAEEKLEELWLEKSAEEQDKHATDYFLKSAIATLVIATSGDYEKYEARETKETIDAYLENGFYAAMDEKE